MKVLIIDDDIQTVQPVINGLIRKEKNLGWKYYAATKSSVKEIRTDIEDNLDWEPDLVLLDVMMPQVPGGDSLKYGGLTLLREIRTGSFVSISGAVNVFLLTAAPDIDKITAEHGREVLRVIPKPLEVIELFECITQLSDKDGAEDA